MNARELLNKLVTEVANGMYDWDNLPVLVRDTDGNIEFVITGVTIEGGDLLVDFHGPNKGFDMELDGLKWLDVVTLNALRRNDLFTLEKINRTTLEEIEEIRNIGTRRGAKVQYMMRENGYPNWGTNHVEKE